jgi:hypothetical protein
MKRENLEKTVQTEEVIYDVTYENISGVCRPESTVTVPETRSLCGGRRSDEESIKNFDLKLLGNFLGV